MKRSWNPGIWVGFVLLFVGMLSYPLFFARFPATRDFPWVNLLIIAAALALLGIGVARAFRRPDAYRGKISGSILTVVGVLSLAFFCYGIFYVTRQLPVSHGAPKVGETAPDFTLPDSHGNPVTLSSFVSSPFAPNISDKTAGTILIFYRGYW